MLAETHTDDTKEPCSAIVRYDPLAPSVLLWHREQALLRFRTLPGDSAYHRYVRRLARLSAAAWLWELALVLTGGSIWD